jgi:dihydrofolate reductase
MRKVVSSLFYSLDGVVEAPDQWSMEYFDADMMADMQSQIDMIDTVLLGRVSYEEWAGYWPTSTDEPFASFINKVPKHVVTSRLEKADWQNTTLIKGDLTEAITRLKGQPGKNIGVNASPTLVASLVELDLLDELRLYVYPVIVGKGRQLFANGPKMKHLKLVETHTTGSGVVALVYHRVQ